MLQRLFIVCVLLASGCGSPNTSERPESSTERRWVANAVPPQEGLLGRVSDQQGIRLLTNGHRMVAIDLQARRAASIPITGLAEDERLAGLGRLPDGSLWTLSGWASLLRLTDGGRVAERRELQRAQTGLHSGFDGLLYQPLDFTAGSPALVTIGEGPETFVPWGTLKVREGTEQGPIRLAQSLASCGLAVAEVIPCWLSNSSDVELVDRRGGTVRVTIPALAGWTSNDPSAFARNPHRVIRDVWLESPSTLWLLVRASSSAVPDRGGERGLWSVNSRGEVTARYVMVSRARMILGVQAGRVVVLTAEGHVVAEEV